MQGLTRTNLFFLIVTTILLMSFGLTGCDCGGDDDDDDDDRPDDDDDDNDDFTPPDDDDDDDDDNDDNDNDDDDNDDDDNNDDDNNDDNDDNDDNDTTPDDDDDDDNDDNDDDDDDNDDDDDDDNDDTTVAPPNAPTGIAGKVLTQSSIKITWSDNSSNETGFEIERQSGAKAWVAVHTVGVNVQTYTDTVTPCQYAYQYRVRAMIDETPSTWNTSSWIHVEIYCHMVRITSGSFYMGCEPDDANCNAATDEWPRRSITLSEYFMDKYEITNEEFADYLNENNVANNCGGYNCIGDAHDQGGSGVYWTGSQWAVDSGWKDRPANYVTWKGASTYCTVVGKRLPTEAEWEKAGKGATQHYIYPWGDTWTANAANHNANSDPYESYTPGTTPVGYFNGTLHGSYQTANGSGVYGLYDISGNVWEWVNDWYEFDYYDYGPTTDPQGPAIGSDKVLRGGGYLNGQATLRMSNRDKGNQGVLYIDAGFRCAK